MSRPAQKDGADEDAKHDFAFPIPLEKASEAEQKVAQDLEQDLESGDVEDATTYVEDCFQAFMASQSEVVLRACSEASLR